MVLKHESVPWRAETTGRIIPDEWHFMSAVQGWLLLYVFQSPKRMFWGAESFQIKGPALNHSRSRPHLATSCLIILCWKYTRQHGYPIQPDPNLGPEYRKGWERKSTQWIHHLGSGLLWIVASSSRFSIFLKTLTKLTLCRWRPLRSATSLPRPFFYSKQF